MEPTIHESPAMKQLKEGVAEIEISYKHRATSFPVINSSQEAYEQLIRFFPQDTIALQERFIVGYLNRANALMGVFEASVGGIAGTVADPRLILSVALRLAASSIILCHNHPSGNLKPSTSDETLTNKIKAGGALLEITLLDHLIVVPQEGKFYSWADEGVL